MPSKLTDRYIAALKAADGKRLEIFDPQEPGLLLRVSDAGRKTWFFRYRLADGRMPRLKLGTYPATGIADAHRLAQDNRRIVESGADPAATKRKAAADAKVDRIRTFDQLAAAYFDATEKGLWTPRGKVKRASTLRDERALYERHVRAALGGRLIEEITRSDVKTLARGLLTRGITTKANHTHAFVRQVFSFAMEEELVATNPAMGMSSPAPKRARERVLTDAELAAVWRALASGSEGISPGVADALKLVALLLQRRAEIAGIQVDELDLERKLWTIPAERAKNGRAHVVPLPPGAVSILLAALDRRVAPSAFVFPSPRGGGDKAVHPDALTRAMGGLMKSLGFPLAGPHDLRRTGASALASEQLGVAPFIVSQVLNHTTDAGGGSATTRRHYNLHLYAAEKRRALDAWEGMLLEIVGERKRADNVTCLTSVQKT